MMTSRTICVYASSSDALEGVYFDAASALGDLIAQRGDALIYGGDVLPGLALAVKDILPAQEGDA